MMIYKFKILFQITNKKYDNFTNNWNKFIIKIKFDFEILMIFY